MTETIRTQVAIVGGGIAGVSAAYHIAKRGVRVVLLEKGLVASNASGTNFGGVRTNGRREADIQLSLRAKAIWHKLDDFIGHWCDYRMTGHIEVTHDEKIMAEMEQWAVMARGYGQASELLTPRELRRRYPWVSRSMIGGCMVHDDGCANPRLVVPTMAVAARKLGADIRENTPVTHFEREGHEFVLATANGLKVRAATMINAAGGWGDRVASHFGERYPLTPIAPQMQATEPLSMRLEPVIEVRVNGRFLYLRQVENGNIIFGRGDGKADLDTGRAHVFPVPGFTGSNVAINMYPALRGLSIIRTWSGIDGMTPDGLPVMGMSPKVPGLVHGFGYSGSGFQPGPASGAVLCELALDGRTSTNIDGYKPERFAAHAAPDRKQA